MKGHDIQDLMKLFNDLFSESYQTQLVKGQDEPIYLPADAQNPYHRLCFAHGFFASALHEISHWCVAGAKRRQQIDFGYWYEPDGRSPEKQALFEQYEAKPQALEWIFSRAAGKPFRPSCDNLLQPELNIQGFITRICAHARHYIRHGLPKRANLFAHSLAEFYGTADRDWKLLQCYEMGPTR